MEQLQLFAEQDLQPIRKWLHVWDEERRERIKRPELAKEDEPKKKEVIRPSSS